MGIAAVLFLWCVLAVVAIVMTTLAAFVFRRARSARRPALATFAAFATAASGVTALGAMLFIAIWLIAPSSRASTKSRDFESEFGFAPPPDVRDIRSVSTGSTDFAMHTLAFRASPTTIAKITSKRFQKIEPQQCVRVFSPAPSGDCYVAAPFDRAFHKNQAWVAYDRNTGQAQYLYHGVD